MGNKVSKKSNRISTIWLQNKDLWFNSTGKNKDKVNNLFKYVLDFDFEPIGTNFRDSIDKIIFCNQIIKVIYRSDKKQIDYYHGLAVIEVKKGLVKKFDYEMTPIERCFYLLPLRHTFDPYEILFCINKVYQYIETEYNPIYLKFIKASLKSFRKNYKEWHQFSKIEWTDVTDNNFFPSKFKSNDPFIEKVKINLINLPHKIVVSVKGDVDSMVLVYILKKILPRHDICVINIDYNICDYSHLNSKLAYKWSQYLDVPFRCRKIIEIPRIKNYLRNFYEIYIRAIRFDLYRSFNETDIDSTKVDNDWELIISTKSEISFGVFLGDNQDYLINNSMTDKKKMNIFQEKKIHIFRPFINISKQEIIDYANIQGIPFTKIR